MQLARQRVCLWQEDGSSCFGRSRTQCRGRVCCAGKAGRGERGDGLGGVGDLRVLQRADAEPVPPALEQPQEEALRGRRQGLREQQPCPN